MNTKTKLATVIEAVVQDLARAADEDSVIDQWGLSVAEIEADLTPEQLVQSQDWLDSLVAGARLKFTEDDVTYYYENGKYYSFYGDDAAYDGSNAIGEPEEISPEMMAVILLGIHLDAGTLHVVSESAPSLRFKPDQFNEVPVSAVVVAPEKRGFELRAELQPDLDSDDPENYFTLDLYRFDKKTKSKQLLDTLGGIDTRDADYINELLQEMLQNLDSITNEASPERVVGEYEYRNRKAVVRRNTEWGEFVVQFFSNGEHMTQADYHTDDKADATGTARAWIAGGTNPTEAVTIPDLGVDVDPDRYYVVTGSNSMWGGVDNNFASEAEAKAWVDAYNQHAGSGLKIALGDDDAVIKGSELIKVYQTESGMTEREMLDALRNFNGAAQESFLGEAKNGEEIALRNKNRDGQSILDADGNEIPNSIVFSSGYGGAYSYSGRLAIYSINAITGEMTQVELGEDALPYLTQLV